jgi:putative hydrolase of the HAD superfamily
MRIYPKAVIFDYGQVLCDPQSKADVEAMASLLQMDFDTFHDSSWRYRVAYDEAAMDPASYWNAVAQRTLPPQDIERLIDMDSRSWTHPNPVMPGWARQLRQAGLRTAHPREIPSPHAMCGWWIVREWLTMTAICT